MKNKLTLSIKDFFTKMKLIKDTQELSVKDMDKQIEFIDKEINKAKCSCTSSLNSRFNRRILFPMIVSLHSVNIILQQR